MSELDEKPSEEVSELIQSINESKQEIAAATNDIDKVERKSGRPKGSTDKKPRKKKGGILETPSSTPSMEASEDLPTASMIMPMLEGVIKFPFDLAASRTGCEKLKVTEEEAKPTVIALDQFLRYYMPDMSEADPKLVAAFTLISSVSLLGYAKYQTYADWAEEQEAKKRAETPPQKQPERTPEPMQSPFQVIPVN